MTHKCCRQDRNVNLITELVTGEQMQGCLKTTFGHTNLLGLIALCFIVMMAGRHQGHYDQ
ncbi:hypothetical protein [Pseudomonas fragi]|uniref:hypothetical protein n=1 Tax=Pseudomonas fragi TaxID=296 RepID=UPI001475FBCA|nr:hypothetical protein [Pseudomonas fragi]NNB54187.1 hypothetical protein [Pseudomonas fragi]